MAKSTPICGPKISSTAWGSKTLEWAYSTFFFCAAEIDLSIDSFHRKGGGGWRV